jgi:hypothetical protein
LWGVWNLPERMCSILVGSSGFVSSDKRAIRNEEWDRGSIGSRLATLATALVKENLKKLFCAELREDFKS